MGGLQRAAVQRGAEDFVATFMADAAARTKVAGLVSSVTGLAQQLGEPGPAIAEAQPTSLTVLGE